MRDEYDFSTAIKNPYAEKINKDGYAIVINCGAAQGEHCSEDDNMPIDKKAAESA